MRRAFKFFHTHAGYIIGRAAECALSLARAEQEASSRGWVYSWEHDPDVWQDALSDHRRYNEPLPETCESCLLYDEEGNILAALGGIYDADRNYRRVVEAELASEALAA